MRKASYLLLMTVLLVIILAGTAWAQDGTSELAGTDSETDAVLTRGEFSAMLVKALNMEGDLTPANLLVEKGIMKGYPGGELNLDRGIARVEAVALVARSLGLRDGIAPPEGTKNLLPDGHWGDNLYSWLDRQGLVSGEPSQILNKEQGAAFLEQVFSTSPEVEQILRTCRERGQEKDCQTMRTVMSGSVNMNPRAGVDGAEEILQFDARMKIVQEMALPDRIHQMTTVSGEIAGEDAMEFTMESYICGGEMYVQVPDPINGEAQWYRYPQGFLPDMEQLMKQAQQQTEPVPPELQEFLHYQLLGTTEINGEKVYEIAFYGRVDDFQKFLKATMGQLGDLQQLDLDQMLGQVASLLDSMSYWGIEYVGVDDYLTKGAEFTSLITYVDEWEGEPVPMEALEMTMKIEELSYGEDLTIELPQEVLDAPVLDLSADFIESEQ